jgi:hypothetical protein
VSGRATVRAHLFTIDPFQWAQDRGAIVADNCPNDVACITSRIQQARHQLAGRHQAIIFRFCSDKSHVAGCPGAKPGNLVPPILKHKTSYFRLWSVDIHGSAPTRSEGVEGSAN